MNILMVSNTYTPILGGVERSIKTFAEAYRRKGHRVVIVTPSFKGQPSRERDVIRVPSIQNFSGTDFSLRLPIPGVLSRKLKHFHPDIVHAHHPFFMGDTAVRVAMKHRIPLVFTHHTLFEQYTHYLPLLRRPAAEKFLVTLATGYANLCDAVFAPSLSLAKLIRAHGVRTPIAVVPTGIPVRRFSRGSRHRFLEAHRIPAGSFIVGHIGRLAKEKNLMFLCRAVAAFLNQEPNARFVLAGGGPMEQQVLQFFARGHLQRRVHFVGALHGQDLIDAYRAMNVFAFASHSETQGLVLAEAMAAGTPVVAVDAPGVREVMLPGVNGWMIAKDDVAKFAGALRAAARQSWRERLAMRRRAQESAGRFSTDLCATRALKLYAALRGRRWREPSTKVWERAAHRIRVEAGLFKRTAKATTKALKELLPSLKGT